MDEDEKGVVLTDAHGGEQEMSAVNEAGLYALTFGGRKPVAKPFKRWIAHDAIPSIRKHGMYLTSAIDSDALFKIAAAMQEKEKQIASLQQEKQVMLPKAEFYDAVVESPRFGGYGRGRQNPQHGRGP